MTTTTDTAQDARLQKLRAMLAKAESSEFPEERDAFLAKAAELAAQYGIDEALLQASDVAQGSLRPVAVQMVVQAPYATAKSVLVNGVAKAYGVRCVRLRGGANQLIEMIGFESDVKRVEILVTSLFLQLATELAGATPPYYHGPRQLAAWRRSFVLGYANKVCSRLERQVAATQAQEAAEAPEAPTGSTSTALVLADRQDAVNADVKERYPRLTTTYTRASNGNGSSAGRAAGSRANLGGSAVGGARGVLG